MNRTSIFKYGTLLVKSMKETKFLDLKVYLNKKTGQASVVLPKKKVGEVPKKVRVVQW